jgi:hypothetical protein
MLKIGLPTPLRHAAIQIFVDVTTFYVDISTKISFAPQFLSSICA